MDATYLLAQHFARTTYDDLSAEVIEATKKEILDLLGVMIGGFNKPGARELFEIVTEWGGKEESTIIGSKCRVPAPNAAHVNATMAYALDFDDVHEFAIMNSPLCIPALR